VYYLGTFLTGFGTSGSVTLVALMLLNSNRWDKLSIIALVIYISAAAVGGWLLATYSL
jgi:uncharacterized membrane protein YqjE